MDTYRVRWGLVVALLFAGCAGGSAPADEAGDARDDRFVSDGKADAFDITEGSPLAVGVLRLVNTASQTQLDDDVQLDRRAAQHIVEHRDGPDGQLGTADDDPFDTLVELDAVPYVGPIAFSRLVEYARDNGYVDHATGQPEQVLPGPTEQRSDAAGAVLDDGRVLVIGGAGDYSTGKLSTGELYDPATQSWAPIAPMSVGRMSASATVLDDGRVLVAGGLGSTSEYGLATAEIWDPTTDSWADAGTFEGGRYNHTATKLHDGRVVVIGGKSAARAYTHTKIAVYDPATSSWSYPGDTPVGVDDHTATLAPDGSILIVGGYSRLHKFRTRAVMRFDAGTNEVSVVAHLNVGRDHHAAVVTGDELWVLGGSSDRDRHIATVEAIHMSTYEVREVAPMVTPRSAHSATAMPNGDIVVLGGAEESGWRTTRDVDVWDAASGEWQVGTPLSSGRAGHLTFDTPDGILLVGGQTQNSEHPASTLYLGGGVERVTQPPTASIRDWALLRNFGERIGCMRNEIVHHEASGQLICFKGREAENEPIGTYAWTPQGWTEILDESHSPVPPRTMHQMSYDASRGTVVLFGGQKRYGYELDDVWEFDGTSWTQVQAAGNVRPPPQYGGEMVFDSARDRVVLLPGTMKEPYDFRLFAWDGTSWTVAAPANHLIFGAESHDLRRGYAAVYDSVRDRILVIGGWKNGNVTPTYEFDGSTWRRTAGGPNRMTSVDAAFDPTTGETIVVGVVRNQHHSSEPHQYLFDGSNWKNLSTDHQFPHINWRQAVVYTPELGVVVGGGSLRQLKHYPQPNHRPRIGYPGTHTLYPNEAFSLQIEASDADGHELTLTSTALPDGMTFNAQTGRIAWRPRADQGGVYSIMITASDGALSFSQELELTVEGQITYPMLPTGQIDMSGSVRMSGTVQERRPNGYDQYGGNFRVDCDFTGANPGRVMWTCAIINTSRWPHDHQVVTSGQLHPDGRFGTATGISGYVDALQWDDYEVHVTGFDVSWQQGQQLWSGSGDYAGYLNPN